jgi:hypothetical protein
MANLIEELFSQMNRVREIVKVYESLPDGAGMIGASMMKASIANAEKAISSGDVVAELQAFEDLKGFEE